jgi:hypothetical protein
MPQFIEALAKNIDLFRQRYGELPGSLPVPPPQANPATNQPFDAIASIPASNPANNQQPPIASPPGPQAQQTHPHQHAQQPQQPPKRQNPQDIYDELKIKDEILSGTYANAVMIGHGPYEFSFDFITNFYPQSAVSCRVYLASGHIARLLDSLKQSWDQLRPRIGFPPTNNP